MDLRNINTLNNNDFYMFNTYKQNHDYFGLANTLKGFYADDYYTQAALNNKIKELQSTGRKWDAIMSRANVNERQAIAFYSAMTDSNPLLPNANNNIYTQQFVNNINKAGGKDATGFVVTFDGLSLGEQLSNIGQGIKDNIGWGAAAGSGIGAIGGGAVGTAVGPAGTALGTGTGALIGGVIGGAVGAIKGIAEGIWNNITGQNDKTKSLSNYNQFKTVTGYGWKELQKMGVKIEKVDGETKLYFDKTNPNVYKVYQALKKAEDRGVHYNLYGTDENDNRVSKGEMMTSTVTFSQYMTPDRTKDEFLNAYKTVDEAKKVYNKYTTPNDDTQITVGGTFIPFASAYAAQCYLRGDDTGVEKDTSMRKRALRGINLENQEIWAAEYDDTGKQVLTRITDADKLHELNRLKDSVLRETDDMSTFGKNIDCFLGMSGDKSGAYIKIYKDQRTGMNGKHISDGKEDAVMLFIPSLWTDEAQQAFEMSTKTQAQKELANMEAYNYDYDLSNGNKIVTQQLPNGDIALAYQNNKTGRIVPLPNREEALKLLNEDFIIQNAAEAANKSVFGPDGIRGKVNMEQINAQIENIADAAVMELYPEYSSVYSKLRAAEIQKQKVDATDQERNDYDELTHKKLEIYQRILEQLNL